MLDLLSSLPIVSSWDAIHSLGWCASGGINLSWMDALLTSPLASEPSLIAKWGERLYNILLVAIGLGFVIFVHELGHFLAAKAFGVKCDKFYVGFDVPIKIGPIRLPSKLFHFQWGETEYGIGAIPLGGYVKMLGQDDDPRKAEEEAKRIRLENPNAAADGSAAIKLDPRSFPAKSVGARMVIISAGVIMNLIFGVLMAAWAYYAGVPYEPAVVGTVQPGDPAWKNGIMTGDRIVQVNSLKDTEISFEEMMMYVLFQGLRNTDVDLNVAVERNEQNISMKFKGTTAHINPELGIKRLTMGIGSTATTRVSSKDVVHKPFQLGYRDGTFTAPSLQPGDVVVGMNGEKLPISKYNDAPLEYTLDQRLHPRMHEKVTLQVERRIDDRVSTVDVEWVPVPLKTFGLRFKPSGIVAVKLDSDAAKAGIQEGDIPVALNGAPIEDAFTLPLAIARLHGSAVKLTLESSDKSTKNFEWKVPEQFAVPTSNGVFGPVGIELPGSGLVITLTNVVSSIEPSSLASKSGLKAGDLVKQIKFNGESETEKKYFEEVFGNGFKTWIKPTPVNNLTNMLYFHNQLQLHRLLWMCTKRPIGFCRNVGLTLRSCVTSTRQSIFGLPFRWGRLRSVAEWATFSSS
jgi:regulator of sigma E protease